MGAPVSRAENSGRARDPSGGVSGNAIAAMKEFGHRLFVAPRPAWPLAIARVLIGAAILGWSISLWPDVADLLGEDSLVRPEFASSMWRWIPIESAAEARLALAALVVCAVLIMAGWRPTIWLLVAFVLLVSVQRRSPVILNSGDIILRDLTLLLALTPTGAAMSLDRVRKHGRDAFFTSALVAPWGLRLVQLQMMVVYIFAFWSKSGELWTNGTAVSTVFRLDDLQRFAVPDFIVSNVMIIAMLTWLTLIVEIALGMLLWAKRLRPILITLGVLLHLSIDMSLLVGFFGIAMIAGLMTFLDADRLDERIRRRVGQPISGDDDTVAATDESTSGSVNPISAPPPGASAIQT